MRVQPVFRSLVIRRVENKDDLQQKLALVQLQCPVAINQQEGTVIFEEDDEKLQEALKAYNIKFEVKKDDYERVRNGR